MFYKNNVSFNLIFSMLAKDTMIYQSNDGSFGDQYLRCSKIGQNSKKKKKKRMLKAS